MLIVPGHFATVVVVQPDVTVYGVRQLLFGSQPRTKDTVDYLTDVIFAFPEYAEQAHGKILKIAKESLLVDDAN